MNDPMSKQLISEIRSDLNKMTGSFKTVLPENVTPEHFIRVVMNAILDKPDFLKCDRRSLISSAMKCAGDGLLADNKEAALIPYGGIVTYQPMVGGILKKIRNSQEIKNLFADVVYDGDTFSIWTDEDGKHIEHRPKLGMKRGQSDNATAVYAFAKLRNGELDYEVLTKEEVENIRKKVKAPNSPAWRDFWGEMAKKTIIKRLAKRLPTSAEVQSMLDRDNEENFDLKNENKKAKEQRRNVILSLLQSPEDAPDLDGVTGEDSPLNETVEKALESPKVIVKSNDPDSFDNFPNGPVK